MNAPIPDPRAPIAASVGQKVMSKQAGYLRWLLTGLKKAGKMAVLDEDDASASEPLLEISKCLINFSDEAALIKGGSDTIKRELAKMNAPMPQQPAAPAGAEAPTKPNYEGSIIDTLHRVLFNLFLDEQSTVSTERLQATPCSIQLP